MLVNKIVNKLFQ